LLFDTAALVSLQADEDGPIPAKLKRLKPSNRPRQPIIKSKYSKSSVTFGIWFLEERPECATIIGRCVAIWSYIETQLALLLASLLHIDSKPAAAIFLTIQNSRIQQQVLRAAAETVLTSKDFELLEALMNIVAGIEKERNDLVHGVYAGSMSIERGIAWVSQRDLVGHTVSVWASNPRGDSNVSGEIRTSSYGATGDAAINPTGIMDKTFILEPEDLETIANKLEWLHEMINFLRGYYSSTDALWRAARYPQLCGEPLIAKELSRMRADQKKTQVPHPSPNRKESRPK
jgi:hypothetical protein